MLYDEKNGEDPTTADATSDRTELKLDSRSAKFTCPALPASRRKTFRQNFLHARIAERIALAIVNRRDRNAQSCFEIGPGPGCSPRVYKALPGKGHCS